MSDVDMNTQVGRAVLAAQISMLAEGARTFSNRARESGELDGDDKYMAKFELIAAIATTRTMRAIMADPNYQHVRSMDGASSMCDRLEQMVKLIEEIGGDANGFRFDVFFDDVKNKSLDTDWIERRVSMRKEGGQG